MAPAQSQDVALLKKSLKKKEELLQSEGEDLELFVFPDQSKVVEKLSCVLSENEVPGPAAVLGFCCSRSSSSGHRRQW